MNLSKYIFIATAGIFSLMSCEENKNPYQTADIQIKVFSNDSTADSSLGGFGYNIYLSGTMYVHQPHIPAINGNQGFKTAGDAEKTAGLTMYKIRNNIMPPSLSVFELDSLGVYDAPPGTPGMEKVKAEPEKNYWLIAAGIIGLLVIAGIMFLAVKKQKK